MHQYDLVIAPLIALLSAAIGLVVYFNDRKSSAGKVMAVMSLSIGIWIISAFFSDITKDLSVSVLLNRLVFAAIVSFVANMLYLPFVFPVRDKIAGYIKWPLSVFSLAFAFLLMVTPYIVADVRFENWGSNIIYGKYFAIFVVYTLVGVLVSVVKFIINYVRLKDGERSGIRLFFIGLILVSLINVFVQVVIRGVVGSDEFYRFGNYSVIIFIAFTAYAVIKHQLFNIKVILTEIAVVIVSIVVFEEIFLSRNVAEAIFKIALLIVVVFGSYLLVGSVIREIKQREELQKLSDELKLANQKLQAIDAMKTEFVSMASHELLTPISAIEGYLSMMLDEKMVKIDDPKAVEYMNRVYKSAKRLARLVADLLNVSRIEEGRLLVEKQDIELEETITSVINELKFKAEGAKVYLESEIPDEAKVKVYADPDKIKEVVINLVGNSIKYSHEGGHVKVRVGFLPIAEVLDDIKTMENVCAEENKDLSGEGSIQSAIHEKYREPVGDRQLVVSVQDNGVGIEKCDVGRLFKKFSRVGDWSTQETPGTGLGLYISKSLVEMHHGRIWAESEGKDKGSIFHFSLPLFETKEQVVKLDSEVPKAKDAKPLAKSAVGN